MALLSNAEQFSKKMYMKTHEGRMNENLHFREIASRKKIVSYFFRKHPLVSFTGSVAKDVQLQHCWFFPDHPALPTAQLMMHD